MLQGSMRSSQPRDRKPSTHCCTAARHLFSLGQVITLWMVLMCQYLLRSGPPELTASRSQCRTPDSAQQPPQHSMSVSADRVADRGKYRFHRRGHSLVTLHEPSQGCSVQHSMTTATIPQLQPKLTANILLRYELKEPHCDKKARVGVGTRNFSAGGAVV